MGLDQLVCPQFKVQSQRLTERKKKIFNRKVSFCLILFSDLIFETHSANTEAIKLSIESHSICLLAVGRTRKIRMTIPALPGSTNQSETYYNVLVQSVC